MGERKTEKKVEAFEKIWDSTRSFLTQIKEDVDKSVKLIRLKGELSQIKKKIESQYQALGEAAYKQIVKKELKEPALEKHAKEITRLFKELKKSQKKIAEINKEISKESAAVKSSESNKDSSREAIDRKKS